MADHVSADSYAVVDTDGETTLTLVTDTGEIELAGDMRDVWALVVDADRQLNREAQQ